MSERKHIQVREVMTPMPVPVEGLATVREALNRMREANVRSLVVERRRPGDEFGIVDKVIATNRSLDRTNVYEIMSKPVLTVDAAMEIKYAIRLLSKFGLSRSLVVDHNEAVGFVTLRDMVFRYTDIMEAPRGDAVT
jgi:CBS domain-containing protein